MVFFRPAMDWCRVRAWNWRNSKFCLSRCHHLRFRGNFHGNKGGCSPQSGVQFPQEKALKLKRFIRWLSDHLIPKLLRFRAGKVDFDPRSFRESNRSHSRSDAGQSGYSYQARNLSFPIFEGSAMDKFPKIWIFHFWSKNKSHKSKKLGDLRCEASGRAAPKAPHNWENGGQGSHFAIILPSFGFAVNLPSKSM